MVRILTIDPCPEFQAYSIFQNQICQKTVQNRAIVTIEH